MADSEDIPASEKVRIASDFLKSAPPGEFNEVFNDVRLLLQSDQLLKDGECARAIAEYNRDQFLPVRIEKDNNLTLVTPFNDLGTGDRFFDPNLKSSFRFDHLRKEATDVRQETNYDHKSETWRSALQSALDAYIENHFRHGVGVVFSKTDPDGNIHLTLAIESHIFQPKNFWNGRWRSQWTVTIGKSSSTELKGLLRIQVHYYEDGNVQLMSSKSVAKQINVSTEASTAKEVIRIIEDEEGIYEEAVDQNYKSMSETTFKALRRQLPVFGQKLDWSKISCYKIGSELKTS